MASADAGITEIHTLHLIRLNCDDEAERFSDEGEVVKTYSGYHGTYYQHRFTYRVD